MTTAARHDAWAAGDSYDAYMGRWSRPIAARFLDWLGLPGGLAWLDLGCGTGALTEAVLCQCAPRHVLALDPRLTECGFPDVPGISSCWL